jgi:class 3 adenylate cyclase
VGEILISDETYNQAGLQIENTEKRQVELKGKSHPVTVHTLKDFRA